MVSIEKAEDLLERTGVIIKHQRDLEKLRGESFTVFSILKMERRENNTHSAFLAELLNPEGSHLKGPLFLELFLDVIGEPHKSHIDLKSTRVKVEHYIGQRNDEDKTGGRIDIYLEDEFGNCISVENKIDAVDQEAQIERYCNHKKSQNKVFYLNLLGNEPSNFSKGDLVNNCDFFTISYRETILQWLEKCIKETAEQPILRESIKQYKLLIKKLTATMDDQQQKDLNTIMFKHFEEAQLIARRFNDEYNRFKQSVRLSVLQKLESKLSDRFKIEIGHPINKEYAQIWIKLNEHLSSPYYFGLETFHGNLEVGVFNEKGQNIFGGTEGRSNGWWSFLVPFQPYRGIDLDFANPKTIYKIQSDENFREDLENHIVDKVAEYINLHEVQLKTFLASNG